MSAAAKDTPVVISGVAALTPIGFGFEAMKRGLRRSEPRIGKVTLFAEHPAAKDLVGAQLVDFDPKEILGKKGLRSKDRNTLIVLSCIQLDLAQQIAAIECPERVGLTVGTTFGSLASQIGFTQTYLEGGFRALNAMEFPNMVINSPPSQGNIWFNLAASSTTISNGFTAGLDALIFSSDQLRAGRADHVLAGGSDDFSLYVALAFERKGLASSSRQVRPFAADRDGTLMGEGAAMMLLERRDAAEQRGATILADVLGYGSTFDGGMDFAFNAQADGATRAMELALQDAELGPEDIDFVAASASGSVGGDKMEADAIRRVFGARAADLPVVAYKSYWGECYGAAGAMQVAAALADLDDGVVSATCGARESSADALGVNVTTKALTGKNPRTVMVNAFGYTGQNSSLILRKA